MYKKILVATDGSEHSLRAAEHAIYLTKISPEGNLVILYVVDGDTSKSDVLRNLDTDIIAQKRRDKMSPIEKKALEAGIHYEIKIIRGEPAPSIVEFVNKNKIDIVIIGSRGLNDFQEFILGSVSHKVAKRANCPVMIVK